MPKRTFKDKMTLGKGNDEINLYYFGRGHTNGDAWVVFKALRVMHAGDIFSGKNVPLLDANNGGSGVEIGKTLAKAAKIKGVDQIITGQGERWRSATADSPPSTTSCRDVRAGRKPAGAWTMAAS
jgi:glyoxylase-like metal-dependent hydrolase (beta-lactamase superfamily II)